MVLMHNLHSTIHVAAIQYRDEDAHDSSEEEEDLWDSSDAEEDSDKELSDSSDEKGDSHKKYPEVHMFDNREGRVAYDGYDQNVSDDEQDCQVMEETGGDGNYSDLTVCSSMHIVMRIDFCISEELVKLHELLQCHWTVYMIALALLSS